MENRAFLALAASPRRLAEAERALAAAFAVDARSAVRRASGCSFLPTRRSPALVDGKPVPVFTAAQRARIPSAWLAGRRPAEERDGKSHAPRP